MVNGAAEFQNVNVVSNKTGVGDGHIFSNILTVFYLSHFWLKVIIILSFLNIFLFFCIIKKHFIFLISLTVFFLIFYIGFNLFNFGLLYK